MPARGSARQQVLIVWRHKRFEVHILPLMLCVVLWGKGEVVHALPFFQGYTVEDWLFDAVLTVVRGNMAGLAGKVGCPGWHISWWWQLLLLQSVLI